MKYVVLLGDGMADGPVNELDGKTPLQYARTPNMDFLATNGAIGMVRTIPEGFPPGSDVANLSVMGYDPRKYYTGRSPLEAVSIGIELGDKDIAFRCNLVTLAAQGKYQDKIMVDYSADEITTAEAKELIKTVDQNLGSETIHFYPGISYRHLLVWQGGPTATKLTPPHDISGRLIIDYLPRGEGSDTLRELMEASFKFLPGHPVNANRIKNGLRPANSIWLWGQGKKPAIPKFFDLYGINGAVISAVDLVKGIGICAGLEVLEVAGATGNIHTNFRGKAITALEALNKGSDFVYIHVEAPDEAGHRGELENKVKAIEAVDEMLGKLLNGLNQQNNPYKIMLLPDHPTPLSTRTHSSDPVPFAIYSRGENNNIKYIAYNEEAAEQSGLKFTAGWELMAYFLDQK
ncbi:MAG: cofactor-independent phosphoglycerate mutase [Desulfotomaculaceae bacterium]|nr:cofactor-independent phosphoglycerate mutase [Desulfotomaculaceae bacterium]